jgi:hypothetical protein
MAKAIYDYSKRLILLRVIQLRDWCGSSLRIRQILYEIELGIKTRFFSFHLTPSKCSIIVSLIFAQLFLTLLSLPAGLRGFTVF